MSILTLSGSPSRTPSRSSALLAYVAARLRRAAVPLESLNVLDLPSDDLVRARRDSVAAARLQALVARSSAIVIAAPIYNASIPGGLKALLDLLPERALHGKPVLPLASGGSAGHQLAIEYSLKPMLSALGARHVVHGVFACEQDIGWPLGPTAEPTFDPILADRLDEAADALLAAIGVAAPAPDPWIAASVPPIRNGSIDSHDPALLFAPERCSA